MKDVVHVTKKDIETGARFDTSCCPVALAVKRHTNTKYVRVYNGQKAIEALGVKFILPRSAARFVRRFDNNQPVKPFRFILRRQA